MFWLVTSPHIPLLSLKLPNVGGCCSRIPSLSVGQIAIVRGKVSEPTLMKRSGESLAQLPVAEEGTSEKAAAAAARRNETTKKSKKHFHSSALPSKPQQKVADKIRQATLQDQFLICGWSPSYQTQNSTPCVPQQMSGPSGPNSPHIPTPEISPWLNLDTQPELRFPGHDLPIFHSKFPPISLANFPTPSAAELPAIIRLITPCHTEPQDASQGIGFLQYSVWIVHHTWNCDCRHPKGSNLAQLGDI